MRKVLALLGIVSVLMLGAHTAFGANFASGQDLIFDLKNPFNDDVYLIGSDISISQDVLGDLLVIGANVTVDGNVSGDITAVGANVTINGNVNDDVRAAAGRIEINGIVGDDVILGGAYALFGKDTNIGGDAILGSAQFDHKGRIDGNLHGAFMKGKFIGSVNRGAKIQAQNLVFGKNAKIKGDLVYRAPIAAQIPDGVVGGSVDYKKYDPNSFISFAEIRQKLSFSYLYVKIASALSFIALGLVIILGTPFFMLRTNDSVRKSTLKVLGVGVVTVLALIIGALLSFFFAGVGIYIGIIITLIMVMLAIFTPVIASALVGSYIVKVNNKSTKWKLFVSFLVGMLVFNVLTYIPVIGWAVHLFIGLTAVGALVMVKRDQIKVLRSKKLV